MTIPGLTPTDSGLDPTLEKVYYEPVNLTISGYSQYRPGEEVSFKEISGFWQLPSKYVRVQNDPTDSRPPIGTVATFSLSTKPKTGPKANPGSLYHDIRGIVKTDQPPIDAQPPQQPEAGEGATEGWQAGSVDGGAREMLTLDQRIAKSQAWNGLTAMLAALVSGPATPVDFQGGMTWDEAWVEWAEGYVDLKAGRVPFVQCPHTDTLGVAPPEDGFKAGDPTETCQACGEGVAPYTRQPEHEAGMAPAEDDWESVPGWKEAGTTHD